MNGNVLINVNNYFKTFAGFYTNLKKLLAFGCQCVAFDEKRNINCQKNKRK